MGDTPEVQAQTINPTETSEEAIDAQIAAIPKILAAQKGSSRGFAQLDYENLKEFLPLYADLARGIQAKDIAFQKANFPEVGAATGKLTDYLQGQDLAGQDAGARGDLSSAIDEYLNGEDVFRPQQERQIKEDIRSGQLSRGQEQFGFSNVEEARGLTGLREQLRLDRLNTRLQKVNVENQLNMQALNTALSTAGRVPVSSGQQIQFQQPGQLVQNTSPSQFFQTAFQNQAAQMSADKFNAEQQSPFGQFAGNVLGTALGVAGGSFRSSIIFKDNIKDNEIDSESIINDLRIVEFNYKWNDKKQIGIILEESPKLMAESDGRSLDVVNVLGLLLDSSKKLINRVKVLEEVNNG